MVSVTFLITAFKEPTVGKAIAAVLNQKTKYNCDIIISAPDQETLDIARKFNSLDVMGNCSSITYFKDEGKGKSLALNRLFKIIDTDILILSDGDVYINDIAVEEIVNIFNDPKVGCVTGRPVPVEDRHTKYGFWANFLFEEAHKLRLNLYKQNKFLECSGYLFAFRKKEITEIPLDVAEDAIIPYYFYEKGYSIGYADKAEVYVKNVDNWDDWIKQKTRTSKAHETLSKYVDTKKIPRMKSFKNEAKGILDAISYPKSLKEMFWMKQLVLSRFFMWFNVFYKVKFKKQTDVDNWERIESTK